MQVAAGSGETSEVVPAVDDATSSKRFYSVEAAAKHWAAPMGIVMRPGGYLHTSDRETYERLPEFLQAPKGSLSDQVNRVWSPLMCRSMRLWASLGALLADMDLMYTVTGPRGGTQYYLRDEQ